MTKNDLKRQIKAMLRGCCALASPLFSRKSAMDAETARENLLACSPRPAGTAKASNALLPPRCDLQIIIPAYNVEAYLAACMDSVLAQETKYAYHVILVDDGAKDGTPAICDRYADDPRVTVIHQKNRGLSSARNTGLKELFGRYVMFVDSDDLLLPGAIEALLNTAFAHDADLVEGGADYVFDTHQETAHAYSAEVRLSNPHNLHGHAWGKVYKSEIFEPLCFPEGYWYEDSLLSFLIFPRLRNAYLCPHRCYGYRINESGIVKSSVGKPRAIETYWITEQLLTEYAEAGLAMDARIFEYLLLQARLNQLRVADLPPQIQESVFVLTCSLLQRYFPDNLTLPAEKQLQKALKTQDFGMFKMCCTFF